MRWILSLVWVISVALVLPYMAYITHVDLSVSATLLTLAKTEILYQKKVRA